MTITFGGGGVCAALDSWSLVLRMWGFPTVDTPLQLFDEITVLEVVLEVSWGGVRFSAFSLACL